MNKTLCENCGKHEGTEMWVGQGGILDYAHGMYAMWCLCCTIKAQIAYAEERAEDLPNLKKKLKKVKCK
jgi:hypothetical protein